MMKLKKHYFVMPLVVALTVGCKQTPAQDLSADVISYAATDAQNRMTEVNVDFANADTAVVLFNDKMYRLPIYRTASGFGYKNDILEFTGKGSMATLTKADGTTYTLIERMQKNGVGFDLSVDNDKHELTIIPQGFSISNDTIRCDIGDNYISNVQIEDLNADNNPELYVFLNSDGSSPCASLIAYSSNNGKSATDIIMPEMDAEKHKGYRGQDVMYIKDKRLIREYPVYKEGDSDADPTGETAIMKYKLVPGEAAWQLVETED